jgi:hypothetical protein
MTTENRLPDRGVTENVYYFNPADVSQATRPVPATVAPITAQFDLLEAFATLSALDAAQHLAEATIKDLRERGGNTEDVEGHLLRLICAELQLRKAMDL